MSVPKRKTRREIEADAEAHRAYLNSPEFKEACHATREAENNLRNSIRSCLETSHLYLAANGWDSNLEIKDWNTGIAGMYVKFSDGRVLNVSISEIDPKHWESLV